MLTSYNGWPASPEPDAIGVVAFQPTGVPFPAGVKQGDVHVVFTYLVEQLDKRVERAQSVHGCWGFNYRRNVNNTSVLSCHASATALDYNAELHPNGQGATWSAAQVAEIQKILAELDSVVRWLRGYDEMHFEVRGTRAEVAAVAARLLGRTPPPPPAPPTNQEFKMDATTKSQLQAMLNESEGQIAGAIRHAIADAVQEITGGVRQRDSSGAVIDPDPRYISASDVYTKLEALERRMISMEGK